MVQTAAALVPIASGTSHTAFYVAAGILAGWAVLVSALGFARHRFPGSLGGQRGVMAISALLVAATIGTAIVTASFPAERTARAKQSLGAAPPVGAPAAGGGQAGGGASGGGAASGGGGQPSAGAQSPGAKLFASSGCGACHTLGAAGSQGQSGPNLDQAKPTAALVITRVTNGAAPMPAFKGRLTPAQIKALAAYVSSVAGK